MYIDPDEPGYFEALIGGHFSVFDETDVDFITVGEISKTLVESYAEPWLQQFIAPDANFRVAIPKNNSIREQFDRIFYSEGAVFGHYLMTGDLPFATTQDLSNQLLVTPLPENVTDLCDRTKFWEGWVN